MSEATKPAQRKSSKAPADISLRKNANRAVLGLTIWCLSLVMLTSAQGSTLINNLVSVAFLLYVCGSAIWLRIAKLRGYQYPKYRHVTTADALVYSAALAYFCACYSCLALVFSIVLLHASLNGGVRQTIADAAAFYIGAAGMTLLLDKSWQLQMSTTQSGILFVGLLIELLNTYLTEMVKIAAAHRGTIDKFMGDGLMVIFGDTNSDGMKSDCLRCVAMAIVKDIVMCRDRGEIQAKGFTHPIKVYQVIDFRKEMGKNQSYFEDHTSGFSIHLDLERIKNYDRPRIISNLEKLVEKVRDKI